jgi:hypothetical protein
VYSVISSLYNVFELVSEINDRVIPLLSEVL